MPYRIFTLPFDAEGETFDQFSLDRFMQEVRVREVKTAFFQQNNQAYWSIFVHYEGVPEKLARPIDLNESQRERYEKIREWRNLKAEDEGVPPYLIATNKQVASIAKIEQITITKLEEIKGFGKARIEKYGIDLLALLLNHNIVDQQNISHHAEQRNTPF